MSLRTLIGPVTLLFLFLFPTPSWSDDRLLVLTDSAQDSLPQSLKDLSTTLGLGHAIVIQPESLEDIPSKVVQAIDVSKVRIVGVVFSGHGNGTHFLINNRAHSASQILKNMSLWLPKLRIAQNFHIYFASCLLGTNLSDQLNFQDQFIREWQEIVPLRDLHLDTVSIGAHVNTSSGKSLSQVGLFNVLFRLTGVDRIYKQMKFALLPANGMVHGFAFLTPVLLYTATFVGAIAVDPYMSPDAIPEWLSRFGQISAGLSFLLFKLDTTIDRVLRVVTLNKKDPGPRTEIGWARELLVREFRSSTTSPDSILCGLLK